MIKVFCSVLRINSNNLRASSSVISPSREVIKFRDHFSTYGKKINRDI